jgi:Homeodomain-like domain
MANESLRPDVVDPDDEEGLLSLLEIRRMQVVRYRLQRYNQTQIAQLLGIDQSTVSRDLVWIKKHWKNLYGTPSGLDETEEVGSAIAVFKLIEAQALKDMDLTKRTEAKARTAYMRTALMAAQMRMDLLQDLGYAERKMGELTFSFRADAVRAGLRREGLLPTDKPAQLAGDDVKDDEIDRWLRSGVNPHSNT